MFCWSPLHLTLSWVNFSFQVEPPKSVLFRNENVAPIFPSDPTETDTCIVADTLDGSQDEVFDTKDNNVHTETRKDMDEDGGEKEQKAGEKIPRMIEYETGPFPVQLQKNRIDSTTYVVRKAGIKLNINLYLKDKMSYIPFSVKKLNIFPYFSKKDKLWLLVRSPWKGLISLS